jgi:plasmid maintenance system killer protein
LEKLAGSRAGQYSIRVNDQWRICFTWSTRGDGAHRKSPAVLAEIPHL